MAGPPPARWPLIIVLCAMWSGLVLTENISNQILPLTIRRFTTDADTIGFILALNPFFGFIANPLVGVLSDKIWTPIGRRAFFLVTGAPVVALCLLYVPEVTLLWRLVVLVVVYQFFQDVLWGSDHPLLADLVPPHQRTFVNGAMLMGAQATGWVFARYGMGHWMDAFGEEFLYRVAALGQVGLVALPALFLRERRVVPVPRARLTVRRYVTDFIGDPVLRRFGALGFTQYLFQSILQGYYVLFAVQTLGLSRARFGEIWSWLPALTFFFALPIGMLAERWLPKQLTLVGGYLCMLGACVAGWMAEGATGLLVSVILFGFGQLVSNVTQKAFFTEFIPRDLIGQICGTYNICLALGRTVALAGGGWVISRLDNDYRWIFAIGAIFGVISIVIVLRIRDVRFEARRGSATKDQIPP
jgi:MFS family permease